MPQTVCILLVVQGTRKRLHSRSIVLSQGRKQNQKTTKPKPRNETTEEMMYAGCEPLCVMSSRSGSRSPPVWRVLYSLYKAKLASHVAIVAVICYLPSACLPCRTGSCWRAGPDLHPSLDSRACHTVNTQECLIVYKSEPWQNKAKLLNGWSIC